MSDSKHFRDCLSRFATGVTVVTCTDSDRTACGITANSFSSVSLDPPLVLWNVAKVSQSLDAYLHCDYFGINVLRDNQESVSAHFAQSQHTLFAGIDHALTPRAVPRLKDTLAWLECRTHEIYEGGDHFIIIGEVVDFSATDGSPLLFFGGAYRSMDTL